MFINSEKIPYISEVLQIDNEMPLFRVYPEDNPSEVFEASSTTGVWKKVLVAIAANQRERGEHESGTGVSGMNIVSFLIVGPEMFGFTHSCIKQCIEHLEGADQCVNYRNVRIRLDNNFIESHSPGRWSL